MNNEQMNTIALHQLLTAWVARAEFDFSEQHQRLQLSIDGISSEEFAHLQRLLSEVGAPKQRVSLDEVGCVTPTWDVFFQQVINSRMYKPRNPSLAIMQVAKDNGLPLDEFKRAFHASQHAGV